MLAAMQAHTIVAVRPRHVPGDGLLHPAVLGAIALLILNDHFLKSAYPGLVTGKLSDFAGLLFFPIFLVAAYEWAATLATRRPVIAGSTFLAIAGVATAVAFTLVKLSPTVNSAASNALGTMQWLASFWSHPAAPRPATITLDPTDLVALSAIAIALAVGRKRVRAHQP